MTTPKLEYWIIPPEANGEFAAAMDAVLRTYEWPYAKSHPVVCMDKQPGQWVRET